MESIVNNIHEIVLLGEFSGISTKSVIKSLKNAENLRKLGVIGGILTSNSLINSISEEINGWNKIEELLLGGFGINLLENLFLAIGKNNSLKRFTAAGSFSEEQFKYLYCCKNLQHLSLLSLESFGIDFEDDIIRLFDEDCKLSSFLFFSKSVKFTKLIPHILKTKPPLLEEFRVSLINGTLDDNYFKLFSNELPILKKLSIWTYPWGKEDKTYLNTIGSSNLTEIDLGLDWTSAGNLFKAITENKTIKKLQLNVVSKIEKEEYIQNISNFLEQNKILEELFLMLWALKDEHSAQIMNSFLKNNSIKEFSFNTCGTTLFTESVSNVIEIHPVIQKLKVGSFFCGDAELNILTDSYFKSNTNLKELHACFALVTPNG